jgi:hypothetical protein
MTDEAEEAEGCGCLPIALVALAVMVVIGWIVGDGSPDEDQPATQAVVTTTTTMSLLPNPAGFRIPQEDVIDRQPTWAANEVEFNIRVRNSSSSAQYYTMDVRFDLKHSLPAASGLSRTLHVSYCTEDAVPAGAERLLDLGMNLRPNNSAGMDLDVVWLAVYLTTYSAEEPLPITWSVESFEKSSRSLDCNTEIG